MVSARGDPRPEARSYPPRARQHGAPARANDLAACHHGRGANRLSPPPPAATAVYGAGKDVSFQTPVEAMPLSGSRVRFVPPTESTHWELAGQETRGFLSAAVSFA